jgi:hypothetical protein
MTVHLKYPRPGTHRGALALLLILAACCLPAAIATTGASASVYCGGAGLAPGEQYACPSVYDLRDVYVTGTDWVGAAAHLPGGWTLYGNYVTGAYGACHQYASGNTIGPMGKNFSGVNHQAVFIYQDTGYGGC